MKTKDNNLTGKGQRQAEPVMQTDLQLLPLIINNIPQAVFWKSRDLVFLGCNQAFVDDAGLSSPEEIIGKTDFDMPWKDQAELYRADDQQVMQSGESKLNYEEPHTAPDGLTWVRTSKIPVRENGRVVAVLGMFEDITTHKRAEIAVHESEDRFRRFTEATNEGLVFHEQGRIVDANPAALAMFGLSDNTEFIGKNLMEFVVPESHELILKQMQLEDVLPYEVQCTREDGSIFPVETLTRTYKTGDRTIRATSVRNITERKQAEQALRDSEERYSAVVNQANDGVIIIQDNIAQFVNKILANMLGYTPEEVQGTPFINYVAPESRALIAGRVKARLAGEDVPSVYEARLTRKDSTIIDAELSAGVIQYRGRPADVGMIRDITERKRAEEALRASEERFRAIYDNSTIGLYRTTPDGRILMMNPAGVRMMGYDSFDEIAKLLNVEKAGYEQEGARGEFRKKIESEGYITDFESEWKRKDGSIIFVRESAKAFRDENEKVLYYEGSFDDITERKLAEQALRDSQQLLQTVMDNIPQSIFWKDSSLIYAGCNRAFAADVGLASPGDIVGKTDWDISSKDRAELYRADDSLVMKSGTPKLNFEEPQTHADGLTYWLRTSKVPMRDADGNVYAVLGMYEDITERKQADQMLRESQQLLQSVMDNIPQAVFWKDKELAYLGANQAFAEDAGLNSPQDLVGLTDFDMPWKEQAELYRADDQRVFDFGETKLNYEEPQTGPTGKVTWLRTSKIPMQDIDGNIYAVLGMYEDITEWKQLQRQVQEAFERRGYQVQVITEISQEVASASEINDLFDRVVTLTKERLGYYHTQLLRYDPAQDAVVLVNGYGETGQKMLAGGHKLPMGTGLIGTAAASGQTVMRSTLAEDPDWRPNPLLHETKGEIAVPIKFGEQVLGVLDVQSDQAGALTDDDRLLLEGLCGQVAVAMEQTRLRQEMTERLEEVNRLYRSMSHEGWKTYRETADLPAGFMYDQAGIKPVDEAVLADELFANIPMRVLGGEIVGTLTVANDPRHPTSPEDHAFLQQVSDQIALALESARLFGQTQSALAQTERLSEASLRFARSADLQELLAVVNETLGIPVINRAVLGAFNYSSTNELESMDILANWWSGSGLEPTPIGTHYPVETLRVMSFFLSTTPIFFNDMYTDERAASALEFFKQQKMRSVAALPLYLGTRHVGVLFLEAEEIHNFTQDETRLFTAMGPQIATVLENRRQFERAQQQAERESTLNIISQKIQSATTVEAVLQIAARELGHALGAPMTIAQLSMKDKK